MFIYCSQSYTCVSDKAPGEESGPDYLDHVAKGYIRILKVEDGKLYGLRKNGSWKHITDGDPLRQVLKGGCPLVAEETE